ncbi:energy transducer TonB [Psychroserpens sp. XS_ASV72]|uniref:energy transducer TonB n=1 Tax=Psychroserpens sp. XS_ASV72 TaxID=3241293 RepID=UPI0035188AA7
MKNLKKKHDIAGQSNKNMQKSQKHDANLQKNSTLYFQIGLILCLLGTYGIFEMEFETKVIKIEDMVDNDDFIDIDVKNYIVEAKPQVQKQVKKQSQKIVSKAPMVVKNNVAIVPTKVDIATPKVVSEPFTINTTIENKTDNTPSIDQPLTLIAVERVPIYPGCESAESNSERLKCMSQKLAKLIQRKFNTDLAADYGLSGLQKIDVQFRIDKNGRISDIKTRAPLKPLEDEAERVVGKIPQMTPGMQRNQPVSVIYNLPIKFKVQ